jgi:putative NIF3 family GTP cyclohydrolase 1 type 2
MEARCFYRNLESMFLLHDCQDSWPRLQDHPAVCDEFKRCSMGLVLDFASRVERTATAVFPSPRVLAQLRDAGFCSGVLLTHHPMHWDLKTPDVWSFPGAKALDFLRDRQIALYALHSPLDRDGPCATGRTFAEAIGVGFERTFYPYMGHDAGVIGRSPAADLHELTGIVASAVGHDVTTHAYNRGDIERIGVAGGGVNLEAIEQAASLGVQAIVTGISVINAHSESAHASAARNGIAWIGASHYSSERFACEALAVALRRMGLPSHFCADTADAADMGTPAAT